MQAFPLRSIGLSFAVYRPFAKKNAWTVPEQEGPQKSATFAWPTAGVRKTRLKFFFSVPRRNTDYISEFTARGLSYFFKAGPVHALRPRNRNFFTVRK